MILTCTSDKMNMTIIKLVSMWWIIMLLMIIVMTRMTRMTMKMMLMISTCTSDKTCASQDQLGNGRSASAQMGPEQGSEDDDHDDNDDDNDDDDDNSLDK